MRTKRVTDKQRREIKKHLKTQDRLITDIMYQTGLRVSDILRLPAQLDGQRFSVTEQKTGKTRTVSISTRTLHECERFVKNRQKESPRLFTCHRTTVYRHIRKAAAQCGYKNISAHSYRKAFARKFYNQHGLEATQQELQHGHIATTLIYVFDFKS